MVLFLSLLKLLINLARIADHWTGHDHKLEDHEPDVRHVSLVLGPRRVPAVCDHSPEVAEGETLGRHVPPFVLDRGLLRHPLQQRPCARIIRLLV